MITTTLNPGLTPDRVRHSLAVANRMRDLAISRPTIFPINPDDAFTVGCLHDIGYAFEPTNHAQAGGLKLSEVNFPFWKEVYYHGMVQDEYSSPMLNLLNYADMTTSPTGEYITMESRISDISNRYGKGSKQEVEALKLSKELIKLFD